ncbi:maturation protein [ssRNA phage SRR6960507_11]|uniref:Maturation protein n=1 Tax=ssRNA phage SRR6960507_11 TaxID=2786509 RepID=A0A8S5KYY0_9VIRU|nr:maturation protein [ssRNA phage SRR6960507_11]DAD50625.1 TPA_asm: maturation protein [ssRNA phage SRR6960507_11]
MPSRYRSRELGTGLHKGGRALALKPGIVDQYVDDKPLLREQMHDVVGNRQSTNFLEQYQDDWVVGWYSGKNSSYWNCEKYLQYFDAGGNFPEVPDYTDAVAATMALARTNPSRPNVDVWNFLYELKDIPQMIFQVGNLMRKYGTNPAKNWPRNKPEILRDVGSAYLGWTFGWEQLQRDLMGLLDFVGRVDQRAKELDRLMTGALRRRATLIDTVIPFKIENAFYCGPLYQSVVRATLNMSFTRRIWVRVQYAPTSKTFQLLKGDRQELARSLVFGHRPDISTVWNAIPWTWLIDWFSTAGDYFAANRNHLGLTVSDIAIMRESYAKLNNVELVNPLSDSDFTENKHFHWHKRARVKYSGGPVITAYVPYLDGRNWSILSALAAKYLPR